MRSNPSREEFKEAIEHGELESQGITVKDGIYTFDCSKPMGNVFQMASAILVITGTEYKPIELGIEYEEFLLMITKIILRLLS